ncbi:unnamed protein product [Euphydryas editha]|uniref:BPTI/Kunitz inhibitor domain-containing protein n=1 Tax=Euphydryas editha TaxID=104508 RepID=A0AAU9TJH4_EUPED|nr:unnamed protein product [Euphydryas editha]
MVMAIRSTHNETLMMDWPTALQPAVAGLSLPPDYCLQSLNKSNCNVSPIRVFSYYKPGSRCELEVWRGCPTDNIFRTERACINMCIRRIRLNYEEGVTKFVSEKKLNEKCHAPVKINKCNSNATRAFVYNKATNECDEIIWTGCPHKGNVFEEQLDCLQTCYQGELDWNDKINVIPDSLVNEIDTILDNITLDDADAKKKKLLHKIVTKKDKNEEKYSQIKNITKSEYNFTKEPVTDIFVETTPTTTIHHEDDSYSTVNSSEKVEDKTTTKAVDKTIESSNYSSTTKDFSTTNKSEVSKITTIEYTTPETTQTTESTSVSTTTEVTTTKTESTFPDTTKTTESTTITTTVEEETTIKTTTVNIGTAKEVVLPQDFD